MPYRNIVFVKLEKRLLHDHRFFTLTEYSQLNFIKILLALAETFNKLPDNPKILKQLFHTEKHESTIEKSIKEIQKNFPKLIHSNGFYSMGDFEEKTNYIPDREIPGKSQGLPKDVVDKDKDKDKEEDKDKRKKKNPPLSDFQFLESLKNNPAYKHINIDLEFGKMDAWLSTRPGRIKTRRFVVNWLNKIDKPLKTEKKAAVNDFTNTPTPQRPEVNAEGLAKIKALTADLNKKMGVK